jgi:GntP family gluconate:H+ symporter
MQDPLFILAVGILFVVGGIIGLRLHAFLALLLGAFVVAFLTPHASILLYATEKGMNPETAEVLANTKIGLVL